MDQVPFVALLGGSVGAVFVAGVVITGLIGGVQYLADRRYVTQLLRFTPSRMSRCMSPDIVWSPGGVPFRAHP